MKIKIKGVTVSIDEKLILADKSKIKRDIQKYLSGNKVSFNYKIELSRFSPFQRNVLLEMRKIPYGSTLSYSELAKKSGNPKAARAVGNVCSANPSPIIIPCHRVIAKHGLGGFGYPIWLKKHLLDLESLK